MQLMNLTVADIWSVKKEAKQILEKHLLKKQRLSLFDLTDSIEM